ncbi:general stress protein [Phormidium sp. CCY1219]|uniref:general stress protein n=1 Tax=Phormidium sp. CCY1219 TaxID=2886104 RepID=UPI002D1F4B99|nr:general stress protein [Phormidium sp. CCY1219]MEB3830887.1 general stress protein [Phormidium sp. CCY1219]
MAFLKDKRAVGVFSRYEDAEAAFNELRRAGFSIDNISIIAPDIHRRENVTGVDVNHHRTMGDAASAPATRTYTEPAGDRAGEGAATGAIAGGTVGGFIGLLEGLTALTIPGIGPVLFGGAIANILANTLAGGAIGAAAGGLVGALVGLGIPEERARVYNERVSRGDYLLIVEGTEDEIRRAERILSRLGIEEWGIYDIPGESRHSPSASMSETTPNSARPVRMEQHQRAVGLFSTSRAAEEALQELRDEGFPMEKVSVIARDRDRQGNLASIEVEPAGGNKADEGAAAGAITGGAVGGLTGLLVGLGALAVPGVGPLLLVGAEATALASTVAGGAIGAAAGGLVGALIGLGIPEERAKLYSDRVAQGDYLVLVTATEGEIRFADSILNARGIREWGIYELPGEPFPESSTPYRDRSHHYTQPRAGTSNYHPTGRV